MSLLDPLLSVKANLAPNAVVGSVAATPGWEVVAAFWNVDAVRARLEAIVSIAQAGQTCRVRLVALPALTQVDLSLIATTTQAATRIVSVPFQLAASTIYQLEVECTGGFGDSDFAVLHAAKVIEQPPE